MRFHDLRHFAATKFAPTGASTKEIMSRGGWRSVAMRFGTHGVGASLSEVPTDREFRRAPVACGIALAMQPDVHRTLLDVRRHRPLAVLS